MEECTLNYFTILNYQGSKKNLIEFIHRNLDCYLDESDVIFDIFCGACSVGYSYKSTNTVYANDKEKYAQIIASALLGRGITSSLIFNQNLYNKCFEENMRIVDEELKEEQHLLKIGDVDSLILLYNELKTVWNSDFETIIDKTKYQLFLRYYSASYFGIRQSIEIDSIREVIDKVEDNYEKDVLLTCLFYAMKECVFSKDGHMAQPLDFGKNKKRLLVQRQKSIYKFFIEKLEDFASENFVCSEKGNNLVFNNDFETVIKNEVIREKVTVIYADPPYTDMQYSRYYHLLNTVVEYNYPEPTVNGGKFTKGLYLNNRFQSQLSKKSTCLNSILKLISFCKKNNKTLAISFAYPQDREGQRTDRYVMDIDDLIEACVEQFGQDKVHVKNVQYEHSNNRNSKTKKVLEYLIICERERLNGN